MKQRIFRSALWPISTGSASEEIEELNEGQQALERMSRWERSG